MSLKSCKIVSFDIGRNNLCVCVYDHAKRKGLFWKNFDLELKVYHPAQWRNAIRKVLLEIPVVGDVYVTERQLIARATKNCLIETIIHCIVAEVFKVSPVSIGANEVSDYFSLSKESYHMKKQDAVHLTEQILQCPVAGIKFEDVSLPVAFLNSKTIKKDDLADSFLQAIWYGENKIYHWPQFSPARYEHYKRKRSLSASSSSTANTKIKTKKLAIKEESIQ